MKSRIIFVMIFMILMVNLYSTHINEFTDITFNHTAADYGVYNGSIYFYEDRLYSQSDYKIEEYQILGDGTLERLSFYETKLNTKYSLIIDESYLYAFPVINNHINILQFDISQSPMQLINQVEVPTEDNTYITIPRILGDYLIYSEYIISSSYIYDKQSLEIVDEIDDLYGIYTVKDSTIIQVWHYADDEEITDVVLRFYDFNNITEDAPYGVQFNEISIGKKAVNMTGFETQDNFLQIYGFDFFLVYDISDINNPVKLVEYYTNDNTWYFIDILLNGEELYTVSHNGLNVYDISDTTSLEVVFSNQSFSAGGVLRRINLKDSYLYINQSMNLQSYDIENQFNTIQNIDNSRYKYIYNDAHILKKNSINNDIEFFSVLESNPIIYEIDNASDISDFSIKNDILVFSETGSAENFLKIYQLNNDTYELIIQEPINHYILSVSQISNLIFLSYKVNGIFYVDIYTLDDNALDYVGNLQGRFQMNTGYVNEDYFLILSNHQIKFYQTLHPLTCFYSIDLPNFYYENVAQLNENHILTHIYYDYLTKQIFNYDMYQGIFEETNQEIFDITRKASNYYNNFLSINSLFDCENKYYSIVDGVPLLVGELESNKAVNNTYIYPELYKMVQYAHSGIHVYDIEYTVSSSDQVVEYERETYVYPNPVNGGDVNFKTALSGNDTEISIYNIKGQLVKTSKAFQTKDNESIFTWDKRNNQNQSVASGVYFYKIKTDDKVKTGKFLIMK
ncbi:MAG: T9SS type A sorting domain-containing protein [Candidatus Cloacimonetes bacterium]|nr:T9SS type A sorting domain-containing protein [Candidatus Cloacimonadota bacterium]